MIKVENTEVLGWGHAIRGMRNPLNSWDKMDSHECDCGDSSIVKLPGGTAYKVLCPMYKADHKPAKLCGGEAKRDFCIGENDHALMMRLAKAGGEHAKYRRMIVVYADVTAPRYWWAEYDTYKVGTVANIYRQRLNHKLDEWREFCKWIEQLPYSELINGKEAETND